MKCASISATPQKNVLSMQKVRVLNFFGVSPQMIVRLQEDLIVAQECLAQLQARICGNLWIPSVRTLLRSLEGAVAAQSKSLPASDFAATSHGAERLA